MPVSPASRHRLVSFSLLSVLVLSVAFGFQGSRGLWEPDEGFYVTVAAEMLDTGDWITPRLHGYPFLDKPPLMYWGSAAGMKLLGRNEWGARAFNAACLCLTALMVGLLGASMFSDARTGFLSALVYGTMILPVGGANAVTADTPLALWVAASYYCFWRSVRPETGWRGGFWKFLMCAAMGLGFLTKGPALLVACSAMLPWLLVRRRAFRYFLTPWAIPCAAVFAGVGLVWYAYVAKKIPGALEYFLDNQVSGRLVTEKYERNPEFYKGFAIYGWVLTFGAFPWLFAWPSLLKRAEVFPWRKEWWKSLASRPASLLLVLWAGAPLAILLLASSKLPLYALPLLPAVALATGRAWALAWPASEPGRAFAISRRTAALLAVWAAALVALKGGASVHETEKDARALWEQVRPHLPQDEPFEIMAVDRQFNGLAFYAGWFFEPVTTKDDPYPFFMIAEDIDGEVEEVLASRVRHAFICRRDSKRELIEKKLRTAGAGFVSHDLGEDRHLIVCDPSSHKRGSARMVAVGDTGTGKTMAYAVANAIADHWEEWDFPVVMLLGDNFYAHEGDFPDFKETVAALFERPYKSVIDLGVEFRAILGNHDYREWGHHMAQTTYAPFNMGGKRYYQFSLRGGMVDVFCLDSEALRKGGGDRAQLDWFQEAIAASKAPWKVVALHHPVRATAQEYPTDPFLVGVLEPVFLQYGVAVVLSGHNHIYERLKPVGGIHYVTAGSGSKLRPGDLTPGDPARAAGDDQTNVFVTLEFFEDECRLAAYDFLDNEIDSAIIERPGSVEPVELESPLASAAALPVPMR